MNGRRASFAAAGWRADTFGTGLLAGHTAAAAATQSALADIKSFEVSILARVESLRGVWKAVEWDASGDWGPGAITPEVDTFAAKDLLMPRAYDLVGDVTTPAEIFLRLDALESMADTLAAAGHHRAANETLEYLAEARDFEVLTERRLTRLRGVWKAVEMTDGTGTPDTERQARADAAVEEYMVLGAEA